MAQATLDSRSRARPPRSLYDREVQGIIWQVVVLALVLGAGYYLYANMVHNLETRRIQTGFDFLEREAGFAIGESLIPYSPASTYAQAILVGLFNTLQIAVIGVVLATVLGILVGVGTLSSNVLLSRVTGGYIHLLRNIPVLLQIILWYSIFINDRFFPGPRQAEPVLGAYFTQRGAFFPIPAPHPGWTAALVALLGGLMCAWAVSKWAAQHQRETGQQFPAFWAGLGVVVALPLIAWVAFGAPTAMSWPEVRGFNLGGGARVTPELLAVLIGLTVYTSAFIGEIVRSGILSVPKGQTEAAQALGLKEGVILRKVTLPQALRVIVPPLTSQYLNLTKNSSLSLAVGYPDIVSTANTTLNQTGQAPEGILIIMAVYLTFSIATALFMNWYNRRIQLVER